MPSLQCNSWPQHAPHLKKQWLMAVSHPGPEIPYSHRPAQPLTEILHIKEATATSKSAS